ncbi:MAG: hypothetical protein ACTFAL_02010 [Candidatus Electronema sp. V4]|uniref:hypothetical protein n=1 Tax=Candidatus Electronema sp. V4 TaxID=3454756 RepID=UPI0040555F7B
MTFLADTHLHLYSCYNLDHAFSGLLDRLTAADVQALCFGCLAERAGCNFYAQIRTGNIVLHDFSLQAADSRQLILQRKNDGRLLTLLPGRQIIAAERIEVLALCTDALFADGLPAAELIKLIREQNGVPVLPWSPGKWFFQRGKMVDHLLRRFTSQDFLLGDVSLRPVGWPLPLLMRKARRLGYKIISGSDPLPFPGEEAQFGRYASRIVSAEAGLSPDDALRGLLAGKAEAVSFGHRSTPLELLRRLRYNAATRRQQPSSL